MREGGTYTNAPKTIIYISLTIDRDSSLRLKVGTLVSMIGVLYQKEVELSANLVL